MNRVAVLVAVLCWPVCMIAQTSTVVFKPGDKITLIVKFERKVAPDSSVQVLFDRPGARNANEDCKTERRMEWSGNSPDNQTFTMVSAPSQETPSGRYEFSSLALTSPGFVPNGNDQHVSLAFEVKNDIPCPKPVDVPKFDISIKP
jgi:hypothetical protein